MIATAFILSFVILFIHACFWPGMILGFISESMEWMPGYIRKPVYECVICMTPWWSILISIIFPEYFRYEDLQQFLITIAIAGGIATLFDKFIGPIHKYDRL